MEKKEIKTMFKNIFALGIYRVSGVIIYSTDNIVISAFIGVKDVAIIGNFTLIINSIRMAIEQISESTKSSVGNLVVSSTRSHQKEVFDKINFLAFIGVMFCSTCFFVLLNPFISDIWLDKSYRSSILIISILIANFFIAVMVYPVEVFRNANGLFIQGRYRPAIMAVLNITLDIIFVKFWGIAGVLFATTISRLFTQVWFDAYLIYKYVFLKSAFEYYKSYFFRFVFTALSCILAYCLSNLFVFSNVYIGFLYKMLIASLVPILLIYIIYHNRDEFLMISKVVFKIKKKLLKG